LSSRIKCLSYVQVSCVSISSTKITARFIINIEFIQGEHYEFLAA